LFTSESRVKKAGMKCMDFEGKTTAELLTMHAAIMEELRGRNVLRSATNSVKGYDALDDAGTRYQVKGRRIHQRNKSRQLSAIRDLDGFDVLAVVLFIVITRSSGRLSFPL
jgi:hypothetical protein